MPTGVIINSLAVLFGGLFGSLLGDKLSTKFKTELTLIFGVVRWEWASMPLFK